MFVAAGPADAAGAAPAFHGSLEGCPRPAASGTTIAITM
jgi:hypothetical protein